MTDKQLSPNFALSEFVKSNTAENHKIDNTPSTLIVERLTIVANNLEIVRALLGHPVSISSGYRCFELNKLVGGVVDSAHLEGYAADIKCPSFGTPLEIVKAISASTIKFDQLIQEGTWAHISFDPRMRNTVLTAHFDEHGHATYTEGI
jgi:hypothetical protein